MRALVLATGALLLACGGSPTPGPAPAGEPAIVPPEAPPALTGWVADGEPRVYDAGNLWEAINGAADLYLAYGFAELTMRDHHREEIRATVEVYDQTAPINAFGVYRRERPEGAAPLAVGGEAVAVPPYDCLMVWGRHYVRVRAFEGELDAPLCAGLLEEVGATLTGEASLPAELALLPEEGRVPGSEGYTLKSYLGTSDLDDCLFARYEREGVEFQLFAVLGDADARWSALAAKWKEATVADLPALVKTIPYQGAVVVARTPKGLLGIAGPKDAATAAKLLGEAVDPTSSR